jgi:hypothetical protein
MSDPIKVQAAGLAVEVDQVNDLAKQTMSYLQELIDELAVTRQLAAELRGEVGA